MPTPVLYSAAELDPFAHLPDEEMRPELPVFYATNRIPDGTADDPQYSNGIGTVLHLGETMIRFGDDDMTWPTLDEASRTPPPDISGKQGFRDPEIPLYVVATREFASWDTATGIPGTMSDGEKVFAEAINARLARVRDKQLILYVHGAKQNFYSSAVFTAQVNHFLGRDLVGVGFAWPTHQDIIEYGIGVDVARARKSAEPLAEFIDFLADHTDAERINIVCWSAGGRVTSRALAKLRERNADLDSQGLLDRFRLGVVMFAAADVPKDDFRERLPAIHEMSGRVTIMMSDEDGALNFGKRFMGGGERIGQVAGELDPEFAALVADLDRLEVIDVSHFQEDRGFDITGHNYWFAHAWTNTDVLLNIRTYMGAAERGLEPTGIDKVWGFTPDYAERVDAVVDGWVGEQPHDERQWHGGIQ